MRCCEEEEEGELSILTIEAGGMEEEGIDVKAGALKIVDGVKVVGGKGWIWGKEEEVDDGKLLEVIAEMYGEGILGEEEKRRMIHMVMEGKAENVRKTLEIIEMEEAAKNEEAPTHSPPAAIEGNESPKIPDPDEDERGWDCLNGDLMIQDDDDEEEDDADNDEDEPSQPISPKVPEFAPVAVVPPVPPVTTANQDQDSDSKMIPIEPPLTTNDNDTKSTSLTEWIEPVEEEFSGSTSTYVAPKTTQKKGEEKVADTEENGGGGWGKFVGGALLGAGVALAAAASRGGGNKKDEKKKDEGEENEEN